MTTRAVRIGHPKLAPLLGLIILGLVVYLHSLSGRFVPYDDPAFVTENGYVRGGLNPEGLRWAVVYGESGDEQLPHQGVENLWHPLTWISHMVDVQFFGIEDAGGHRAMSLALHILASCLLFFLAARVLDSWILGFAVAALWMVHPLKVESAAWISERKGVLSGAFAWASLLCALREEKWLRRVGFFLFIGALLSKPSTVILPGLLILLRGYLGGESRWGVAFMVREIRLWWHWIALAMLIAGVTVIMQGGGSHEYFSERSATAERLFMSGLGLCFYLYRIVVPCNLCVEYPVPAAHWAVWLFALLTVMALAVVIWRMRERWSLLFLGTVWFLICWLPVSGLFYVGSSFTADRYLYLALAGPLFCLVSWLSSRRWGGVGAILIAIAWSVLSWQQVKVWNDGWSLFQHAIHAQPRAQVGWVNLGGMYQEASQWEEAAHCYEAATALDGGAYISWFNLGNVHKKSGQAELAKEAYQKSLLIYPEYRPALLNLGMMERGAGRIQEARSLFQKGSAQDLRMLWLWCESEILLGNHETAERLLVRLETQPIQNPEIRAGMLKARGFLEQRAKQE